MYKLQSYTSGRIVQKLKLNIEVVEKSSFVDSLANYLKMRCYCLGSSSSLRETSSHFLPTVTMI